MTEEVEKPQDFGKDAAGTVRRWLAEIKLARDEEKDYRGEAERTLKAYRGENYTGSGDEKRRKDTFNILWSNTEIKRPAIYNSMPRPDVRRRFRDEDKLGKVISELMERCATFFVDYDPFEIAMIGAVNDLLLPGRAVTRIRYVPTMQGDEVAFEEVQPEQVQWDDFTRGPGRSWNEVNWVCFSHMLSRDEVEDKWPDYADKLTYSASEEEQDQKEEDTVYKRARVYEIWDKQTRKVTFIAPCYKDAPLSVEDDPLNLRDFFPIPRPMMAVEDPCSLIPIPEYALYETLARELEKVTNRIKNILGAIRARGVYDSRLSEIEKVFEAGDNKMIPLENAAAFLDAGGLDRAIWMMPVEALTKVLIQLYEYRASVIQQIYEATGISDILRGATNANETLGAQEIKANFGTQRLQRQQREMQRYIRDLIRIMVEIIAEKFSPQTIAMITGMEYPTDEQKQQAQATLQAIQQQAAQAQAMMQQLPPEQQQAVAQQLEGQKQQAMQAAQQAQEVLSQPSWEDLKRVMSNDMLREYRIDIETDSTIEAQLQDDQKNIVQLLEGIGKYFQIIMEPVAAGLLPMDAAKKMLMSAVRRFKLGSEVEDELEKIQQPPPPQDPNAGKAEAEQAKMQAEQERDAQRFEMEKQSAMLTQELERERAALERQKMTMEKELAQEKHRLAMEALIANAEAGAVKHRQQMEAARETERESG